MENLTLRGRYRIRDASTGLVLAERENLITSAGKALIADLIRDASGFDTGLTYIALGTGTTPPTSGDSQLVAESTRVAMTGKSRSGTVLTLSSFFGSSLSGFHIREAGVFGHSTADVTPNSGVLFSRTLFNYDNSITLVDLIVDYELEIGKA